jgi:ribonucleoside-diphosphate reductase alpha chain
MRNATLMAVAPNANIGLVVGTTPGIDARFAQVFSRNKISGKYLDLNHNLVKDLRNMGIWEKVKDLIIEHQGDIADIPGIPQYIKDIYKTSFTTSPYAYIEVAARAQKWVDQALSRNMYLETRDIDETMKIYMTAWEKGLKSTYYLHMKPRHTAEQSTVKVNKAEKMGKTGFGSVARAFSSASVVPAAVSAASASPIARASVASTFAAAVSVPVEAKESGASPTAMPTTPGFARAAPVPNLFTATEKVREKAQEKVQEKEQKKNLGDGKKAKSAYMPLSADILKKAPKVCPADPADRAQCDACQ